MTTFTIAWRELKGLFLSPLAWTVLAVIQVLLAYFFLLYVDTFIQVQPRLTGLEDAPGITDIVVAPLFANGAIVLLLVTPLLTMRLVSEEQRSRTLSLLFSAPVSMTQIVLGKYLGVLAFLWIMLALIALMPLSLLVGAELDLMRVGSIVLGLGLMLAAFAAAGLFMSTLTVQPIIAAISTFGLLLLLWIVDAANTSRIEGAGASVLSYISMLRHYEPLLKGLFSSTDVAYFVLFVTGFLGLSLRRLDAMRLQR